MSKVERQCIGAKVGEEGDTCLVRILNLLVARLIQSEKLKDTASLVITLFKPCIDRLFHMTLTTQGANILLCQILGLRRSVAYLVYTNSAAVAAVYVAMCSEDDLWIIPAAKGDRSRNKVPDSQTCWD